MAFKPVRWKTFGRDFAVIQAGFALFGLSLAVMIRARLGTSAWAVLEVALAQLWDLTPGTLSILVGAVILLLSLAMRERIGWGTLSNILFIGPWLDLALWLIPPAPENLALQLAMLLAAVILMGLASAIYISVDAGAGPRDSLMLAIRRTTGWSIGQARTLIEVIVVALGWLLGGPAGIGTLVHSLLIGLSVQWCFKLLHVEPHRPAEAGSTAD